MVRVGMGAEVKGGRRVPAVQVVREVGGASDSVHRRSAGHSNCVAETGSQSAPGAVLGGCRHAVVVQRQVPTVAVC